MPTYHYRCPACGHDFERFEKINAKARPKCPECGTRAERQISGGAGLLFKGSGFYATDYKRPKGGEKSAESETTAKSEKPETKKPPKSSGGE
jgi:putative FmdB family regulatory protein